MKGLICVLVCWLAFFARGTADDLMTKIVFRLEAPGLSPTSLAAQPKTLYRWGSTMGRIEQEPDPAHPGADLFIANGHDGWAISVGAKTGKHMIDPTTDQFYFWMIPGDSLETMTAGGFELGKELAFMENQKVSPKSVVKDEKSLLLYECDAEGYTVDLYVSPETKAPVEADLLKDGKPVLRYFYLKYSTSLQPDPSLFLPAEDVKITEGNILTH